MSRSHRVTRYRRYKTHYRAEPWDTHGTVGANGKVNVKTECGMVLPTSVVTVNRNEITCKRCLAAMGARVEAGDE